MSASIPLIQELRVRPVRAPMPEPHRTASGIVTESPLLLIDAFIEGGITGHGLLFTYSPAALYPTGDFLMNLEPLVVRKPLDPVAITDSLLARFRLLGTQGLVGMAIAGLDMALWDAAAKLRGLPLCRLLGAVPKPLRAYGAVGHDGVRESAAVAERWAKAGFTGVKVKIGYPDVAEDIAVIEAIRSAAGDSVAILADYNQCLAPEQALDRLRRLDDLGLTWIEEPLHSHDFEGHAALARELRTPVQCGENWWGPLDFLNAARAGASDLMMPEVMKAGGVTGWNRAVAIAETHGIRVSSHLWPEISAHLLSVTPMAHWLEYSDWWNAILERPIEVEGGFARPPDEPGNGISWNEESIARYLA